MRKKLINRYKDEKGAITIWLTLLSVCMLCLAMIVIECIRVYQSKSICICCTKTALFSTMADYEPDIYENYHIFVLDECYGKIEKKREIMKGKLLRYANESINKYDSDEKSMDIMGCSVDKININKVEYLGENNANLINQICAYMSAHLEESNVSELCNKYNATKEKILLCEYIFSHFSSYKSTYILGYMDRKYIYEIEYILMGDKTDNDNMVKVKELLNGNGIDVSEDIICTENEYKQHLFNKMINIDEDILCNRIKEVIVSNINWTYGKNVNVNYLITSIEVGMKYSVEERATKIPLVSKWIDKKFNFSNIEYKEKFEY